MSINEYGLRPVSDDIAANPSGPMTIPVTQVQTSDKGESPLEEDPEGGDETQSPAPEDNPEEEPASENSGTDASSEDCDGDKTEEKHEEIYWACILHLMWYSKVLNFDSALLAYFNISKNDNK